MVLLTLPLLITTLGNTARTVHAPGHTPGTYLGYYTPRTDSADNTLGYPPGTSRTPQDTPWSAPGVNPGFTSVTTPPLTPRARPALLPRPRNALAASLAGQDTAWRATIASFFTDAITLQVFALSAAEELVEDAVRLVFHTLQLPLVFWPLVDGELPDAAAVFHKLHPLDFGIIVTGHSQETMTALLKAPIWFARSRYIILLDTSLQPPALRCSRAAAENATSSVWRAHRSLAGVVLAVCPWSLVVYSPENFRAVQPDNVSTLGAIGNHQRINFQKQKLPVTVFPSVPTLTVVTEPGRPDRPGQLVGVDGWVMRTAAEYFNFTLQVVVPEDGEAHGYSVNGTGSGTLGLVMSGRAWVGFNGRFVKDYDTTDIMFSYPYVFDELCVMAPESKRIPNYLTLLRCFSLEVWGGLLVVYLATAACTVGLDWLLRGARSRPGADTVAFMVYGLLLAGDISKPHATAREAAVRLVFAAGLIFHVVFMGAFQGLLYGSLTSHHYYPEIDTLQALADSDMLITTHSKALEDTFNFDLELMKRLRSNFRIVPKNWTGQQSVLRRRNGAYLRQDKRRYHLVDECPRKYMVSYIVNHNFRYLSELDSFLFRCMDSGLLSLWLRRTYAAAPPPRTHRHPQLSLDEVEAAFFVLGIGILASSCALAAELLYRCVARPQGKRQGMPTLTGNKPGRQVKARPVQCGYSK